MPSSASRRSHCARSPTPRRRALSRATSSAASLISVPTPVALRQLAEQRQQQAAGTGADIEDAQRRGKPPLPPDELEHGLRSASRCPAADRGWPARWQSFGRRSRARRGCARRARACSAGRCSGRTARSRSGLSRRSGRLRICAPVRPSTAARSRRASLPALSTPARCRSAVACRRTAAQRRLPIAAGRCLRHWRPLAWPPARWPAGPSPARRSARRARSPRAPHRACAA